MMLARVADSLYWIGRYIERAEHISRLAAVMLNATLDRTDAGAQAAHIALAAVGLEEPEAAPNALAAAHKLALDREEHGSVVVSLARARENARQVRDQITTETWERLNLLYLRVIGPEAERAFSDDASAFLHDIISDLHMFKGAADATMSHGEGWRFLTLGVYIERAQLIAHLLEVCFADHDSPAITDHIAQMNLLRMGCALEPYLRVYTADIQPKYILQFLLFDEDFPRSIRFSTQRLEETLVDLCDVRHDTAEPLRLSGRLNARLKYADIDEVADTGASNLLGSVAAECSRIHESLYETFVAYPLEFGLPA
jgi:uncharacterized alpha-E superfamily protein